jgi:flagellin
LYNAIDAGANNTSGVYVSVAMSISNVANLNTAIQDIATLRSGVGSKVSVLGFQSELQASAKINQESAVSRIMDVDVAEESTQLARWNTLVQAGTSMIAQANGAAQSALQLLR